MLTSLKKTLAHFMNSAAVYTFQLLEAKAPSTVGDFSNACNSFEGARRSLLGKPAYNRLLNARSSFSPSTTDTSDIRLLLIKIVHELFRGFLSGYFE